MTAVGGAERAPETRVVRALGAVAALLAGPAWALGITWTVLRIDGVADGDIDAATRDAYAIFWLLLTCLLFFGATVGYVEARLCRLSVRWSLLVVHAALVALATVTVAVAALR